MNGESGAGRHGKVYHYYSCYTKKRKLGCDKRPLKKDYIEGIVARDALNLLTDQLIDEIADMAIRQSEQDLINDTHIPQLTAQLSEVEKSITNITTAIEKGIASETLMNRLVQLEHEKKTLNKEIKAEEKFVYRIDRDQIVFWLSQFKYGNIEDEDFRRRLIDLLVNSVTVWDEPDGYKITTAYNLTSCKTKTFRVEKNPAAEEATGFDHGESECTDKLVAVVQFAIAVYIFVNLKGRSCQLVVRVIFINLSQLDIAVNIFIDDFDLNDLSDLGDFNFIRSFIKHEALRLLDFSYKPVAIIS